MSKQSTGLRTSSRQTPDHAALADSSALRRLLQDLGDIESGSVAERSSIPGRACALLIAAVFVVVVGAGALAASAGSAAGATYPTQRLQSDTVVVSAAGDVPLVAGTGVEIGRWRTTLDPVSWDQTSRVLEANIAPPAVPGGYGWALVHITVENIGGEPAAPGSLEVVLKAGGWEVSDRDHADGRVRIPEPFTARDIKPGETLTGFAGFWVPDRAADDANCVLELRVRPAPGEEPEVQRVACGP